MIPLILPALLLLSVSAQNASVPLPVSTGAPVIANATTTNTNTTTTKSSTSNPLIPTSISPACSTFLSALNADAQLSACTTPLLNTLALFTPSSSSSATQNSPPAAVLNSLNSLCQSPRCSDTLLRSALNSFAGNCSSELSGGNAAVLGSYDVLYIISPFMTAVCSRDGNGVSTNNGTMPGGAYCLEDIVSGVVPSSGNSINGTTLSNSNSNATSSSAAPLPLASAVNGTAPSNTTTGVKSFAVQSAFNIDNYATMALNPLNLFIQVGNVAKRLMRRQLIPVTGAIGSLVAPAPAAPSSSSANSTLPTPSSNTTSSAPTAASQTANASAPAGNGTIAAPGGNSTSLPSSDGTASATGSNATATGIVVSPPLSTQYSLLPNSTTYRLTSLPFLFLSPSMSSTLLCTTCTKTILASYVAWESRSPYVLGLSNSPLLGGQGTLWNGVGGVCGTGFLESIAGEAGQKALLSAGGRNGPSAQVVMSALTLAVSAALLW